MIHQSLVALTNFQPPSSFRCWSCKWPVQWACTMYQSIFSLNILWPVQCTYTYKVSNIIQPLSPILVAKASLSLTASLTSSQPMSVLHTWCMGILHRQSFLQLNYTKGLSSWCCNFPAKIAYSSAPPFFSSNESTKGLRPIDRPADQWEHAQNIKLGINLDACRKRSIQINRNNW